ncbi:MAG: type II toxin-antitoxin system VapC family toxin [Cytophagaceae bacterium]|nr:type II toxin-antitoxin system VapC family toxin [Cytophagaceae bacterium]
MGQQFLIDSNIIIDYLGGKIPADKKEFMNSIINDIPTVSVISKIEVLGFNTLAEEIKLLEDFFNDVLILDMNSEVVEQTILLRRSLKIKTPDAIIAATAIVYQLSLVTRNTSDFKNIPELNIINPYTE